MFIIVKKMPQGLLSTFRMILRIRKVKYVLIMRYYIRYLFIDENIKERVNFINFHMRVLLHAF